MTDLLLREAAAANTELPGPRQSASDLAREPMADTRVRAAIGIFLVLLLISVSSISALTPPFQSPDEINHVKRAYLLSKGAIFLETREGATGGEIDSGLLSYINLFGMIPFQYKEKATQEMLSEAKNIAWSDEDRFSALPNTAVYFPLSYLPQATAFLIGRHGGLSVDTTYHLARIFSLAATLTLLWLAGRLYPVPLPVYALFALPMAIFQMGAASLDSLSFAMCLLAAALFMRAADTRYAFSNGLHMVLIGCLFLLVTTRTNLLGLVWLPLVLYRIRAERSYLVSSSILIALCLGWIGFAALTSEGPGIRIQELTPAQLLLHYLGHPTELISIMYATLTSGTLLLSYWRMFIGILGWIDTPLDWSVYGAFSALIAALAVTVATSTKGFLSPARVSLAIGAILSTLLLFLLFLVTFTMYPANFIGAIQGRYFYPMAIFLGFAVFGGSISQSRMKIGYAIVVGMVVLSVASSVPKLLGRYWAG